MAMKMKLICDSDYDQRWVSKKLNNGDFDYYLILKLLYMREITGDDDVDVYGVNIDVVAPSEVYEKERMAALESMCYTPQNDEEMADLLSEYGISATMHQETGNNKHTLLRRARKQLPLITGFFGFYMDRRLNALGSTGWDFIKGDLLAGLHRQMA